MNSLYRSRENRLIGGVAGGIAEYFNVDVAVIRLLWVLSILFAGGGVLAYIVAWIVIPEQPVTGAQATGAEIQAPDGALQYQRQLTPEEEMARDRRRSTGGLILIGLGILFLAHQLMPFHFSRFIWPLLLIAVGVLILTRGLRGEK